MLHFHLSLLLSSVHLPTHFGSRRCNLPATTMVCTVQLKLNARLEPENPRRQMPTPGAGHLCFRAYSLRPHKIATVMWAKHVLRLMTQDCFSKFGLIFQAFEILRCQKCLEVIYRAPFCVTTDTKELFLWLWAEIVADWHFWLNSLKLPLLFLIVLII